MSTVDETKPTRSRTQLTPQLINDVLTDKYHLGKTAAKIKDSRGVSYAVIKSIDEKYGASFKERFGVKTAPNKSVTPEDMAAYWDEQSKPAPAKKR